MRRLYALAAAAVLAAVALALALSLGGGNSAGPPSGPYIGSRPPVRILASDFGLPSYRGGVVRLRDLRGKVVLVTGSRT